MPSWVLTFLSSIIARYFSVDVLYEVLKRAANPVLLDRIEHTVLTLFDETVPGKQKLADVETAARDTYIAVEHAFVGVEKERGKDDPLGTTVIDTIAQIVVLKHKYDAAQKAAK
jgi:hypothetical protein